MLDGYVISETSISFIRLEWGVILFVVGIPVLVVVLIVRSFARNKRENLRLRLEVGKLADELERMRKKSESNEGS